MALPSVKPTWYATPAGVAAVVSAYGLVHALIRVFTSSTIAIDDVIENVFAQALRGGYGLRQPPLYDWLLWAVQQATGAGVSGFLLLKYGLLTLTALFLFLGARRLFVDPARAALAVFSYSLLYQIGWNIHEGVTHTSLMMTALAATFWLFSRLFTGGGWETALGLGLAIGAGFLAKYGYGVFLLALLLAAVMDRTLRARFTLQGALVCVGVVLAVMAPFLLWLAGGQGSVAAVAAGNMTVGDASNHLARAGEGALKLIWGTFGFLAPLIVLVPLFFWKPFRAGPAGVPEDRAVLIRWVRNATLIALALALLGILVFGASNIKDRYLHPILFLAPLWLFARLEGHALGDVARRWYGRFALGLIGLVLVIRLSGGLMPESPACAGDCKWKKPYGGLADAVKATGARTVVAVDYFTAGNLRAWLPDHRIIALQMLPFRPGGADVTGSCVLVWDAGDFGKRDLMTALKRLGNRVDPADFTGLPPATPLTTGWKHLWKTTGFRESHWGLTPLPPDHTACG